MPTNHVISIRDQRISVCDARVVAGSKDFDTFTIDADSEWDGLSVVVAFGSGESQTLVSYGGEPAEIPRQAISSPGWLEVSVVGYGAGGEVKATTVAAPHAINVLPDGQVPDNPYPDSPDLLGQLVAAGQSATDAADAANEAAQTATDAAKVATDSAALADAAAEYYDDMLTKLYEKWEAYEKQAESQESARVSAENARKSNETARQSAESTRASQESARVSAESARASEFATLKSQSQASTNAANGAATNANNAATYARSVADNLQSSVVGDEDVAEMRSQIDKLGSMLADSTGGFFYMDGTVYCPSSKASVSGSTVTFGSTCTASGTTITLK